MKWISECDARNGTLMHHVLVLRSDALTCVEVRGEDRMAARRRQLRFWLEHYALLKQAVAAPAMRALLDRIGRTRPLTVEAAAGYGWFDLQIGQESFGPLPAEDQAMLDLKAAATA